ncbi:MAG TPA: hypothetical protein VFF80_08150 [Bacillota bacterium]|nr:hypothetical protein [Bacillota bacterium]
MEEVKQTIPPQEKPVETPAMVTGKESTEDTLPKVYPGSGLNKNPARMMKIEEIVEWDMEFGVKVGPIGYDHSLSCPYCHRRMLLVSHEGSRYQKAIRILYQCEACGAHTVVQFLTPSQKIDLPEMNLGEKIQIEKPTPVPNLPSSSSGSDRSSNERAAVNHSIKDIRENRDTGRRNRPERVSETNQIERAERQADKPRIEKQIQPRERIQRNERNERPAGNRSEPVARVEASEHQQQNPNRQKNRQEDRRPVSERPLQSQQPAVKSKPVVTKLPGEQIKKLAPEITKVVPTPASSQPDKRSNAYFRSRKTSPYNKPQKPETDQPS